MHFHSYTITERKSWFICPASVIQQIIEGNKQHEITCKLKMSNKICFTISKQIHCSCKQCISSSNLPCQLFAPQAALSIDLLLMIPFPLFLKYSTPSYYSLWDIEMERHISLVPQSHCSRNLVRLLISNASYWIKLFHVGKVTAIF